LCFALAQTFPLGVRESGVGAFPLAVKEVMQAS
jgi:hypothetical protein